MKVSPQTFSLIANITKTLGTGSKPKIIIKKAVRTSSIEALPGSFILISIIVILLLMVFFLLGLILYLTRVHKAAELDQLAIGTQTTPLNAVDSPTLHAILAHSNAVPAIRIQTSEDLSTDKQEFLAIEFPEVLSEPIKSDASTRNPSQPSNPAARRTRIKVIGIDGSLPWEQSPKSSIGKQILASKLRVIAPGIFVSDHTPEGRQPPDF
jgi:hypothetical protein